MKRMTLTKLGTIVAILAVIVPAGWAGANVTWDLYEQVASNTKWIQLTEFKRLSGIRNVRQLTFQEWHTWCILGQKLGYWRRCPPR